MVIEEVFVRPEDWELPERAARERVAGKNQRVTEQGDGAIGDAHQRSIIVDPYRLNGVQAVECAFRKTDEGGAVGGAAFGEDDQRRELALLAQLLPLVDLLEEQVAAIFFRAVDIQSAASRGYRPGKRNVADTGLGDEGGGSEHHRPFFRMEHDIQQKRRQQARVQLPRHRERVEEGNVARVDERRDGVAVGQRSFEQS